MQPPGNLDANAKCQNLRDGAMPGALALPCASGSQERSSQPIRTRLAGSSNCFRNFFGFFG